MRVHIITDSTSDITRQQARALGIDVVPLKVIFDGLEYRDSIGSTIGTHVGPGAAAIVYYRKNQA